MSRSPDTIRPSSLSWYQLADTPRTCSTAVQKVMADKALPSIMQDVDSIVIEAKKMEKIKKITDADDFNVEALTKKSQAAGILCAWCLGVVETHS